MEDAQKNIFYLFLPFSYEKPEDYRPLVGAMDRSQVWRQVRDKITYMLKHVADKINSQDPERCQCFHYALREEGRDRAGLAPGDTWYTTAPHSFQGSQCPIRFRILGAQLYCFSTQVCMVAFSLCLDRADPFWVANAQYYLKKVSREPVWPEDAPEHTATFLDLGKALVREWEAVSAFSFFFYANPSTERANVLTYLEVPPKDSYRRELYYLRRCYSEGFLYSEQEDPDPEEVYAPSRDILWGISPEAAVCLVCPEPGRSDFIRKTFRRNFNAQYLFMYVLLLHQKYVLYRFLTQIGVGAYNDLPTLEAYRDQLYEFETDFVFSFVTEVPQYQNLYDRLARAFSLQRMYADVREPLVSLGEVRRAAGEAVQKRRDENVNRALLLLSILSFFSALVDSFDFVESFFGWFLPPWGVQLVQVACIVGIVVILLVVLVNLLKREK